MEVLTERPTGSEERFRQRRRARRLRLLRRLLVLLLVVGLIAGAVWLVFFSSRLSVHEVSVTGTAVLTDDEVRRTAAVPLDVPLALSDLDAVAARVETLPAVRGEAGGASAGPERSRRTPTPALGAALRGPAPSPRTRPRSPTSPGPLR